MENRATGLTLNRAIFPSLQASNPRKQGYGLRAWAQPLRSRPPMITNLIDHDRCRLSRGLLTQRDHDDPEAKFWCRAGDRRQVCGLTDPLTRDRPRGVDGMRGHRGIHRSGAQDGVRPDGCFEGVLQRCALSRIPEAVGSNQFGLLHALLALKMERATPPMGTSGPKRGA